MSYDTAIQPLLTATSFHVSLRRARASAELPLLALRRLGWIAPVHISRRIWQRLRVEHRSLRFIRATPPIALSDAVRWLPAHAGPSGASPGLFAHPDSKVEWRVVLTPGARVSAWVGLLPEVWEKNRGGVRFTMRAATTDGALIAERRLDVHPGTRASDRRWRRLSVTCRIAQAAETIVTLATSVPGGTDTAHAWAVWSDPRIERLRSPAEIAGMLRAAAARHGWMGALAEFSGRGWAAAREIAYQQWVDGSTPTPGMLAGLAARAAALPRQPLISVIMPVYNTDPRWLRAAIESVRSQVYPHWQLCIADDASTSAATVSCLAEYEGDPRIKAMRRATNGHIAAASNDALGLATGEYVALLDHDDELTPDALAEMAMAINDHPDAGILYSDEDKKDEAGARCDPFFKPDWSPEHFAGQMYTCHLTVMRRALVSDIGGFRPGFEGTQDYDLWLRAITQTPRIHHVPKVLYHWRKIAGSAAAVVDAKVYALDNMRRTLQEHADRNGLNAEVVPGLALSLFRVKRRITGAPVVAICRFRSAADARQLTGSAAVLTPETTWPNVRVVADAAPASSPASLTRRLNAMIASCDVEYVVLAEDGVEILTDDWIEGLLEYAQDPGVGVVGARLFRPDGRLHHVGIATGVGGVAAHLFQAEPGDAPGWNGGAITPRNYSAVSAALMMTRASVWRQVGGFEPALRSDFFDVDYCLKVREAGLRVVYTPFVEAVYSGPACAGAENPDDRRWMLKRWGAVLSRDPYYNPNLTIDFTDCRARRPAPR